MNKYLALAHREPDQQRQNRIQPKSYRKAALQIRVCQLRMRAFQSLAFIRLRIIGLSTVTQASPSQQWCTGEDSNLRSSKERQIYSLLPLTARPPVHSHPTDKHANREAQSNHPSDQDPSPRTPIQISFSPSINPRVLLQNATFSASAPVRKTSGTSEYAPRVGSPQRTGPALQKVRLPANATLFRPCFLLFL
jgi:hypothetical protein